MNHIYNIGEKACKQHVADIAACFQEAVVEVLVKKTIAAAQKQEVKQICLAGGVAVNKRLRLRFEQEAKSAKISVLYPSPQLCTDNGAMIAAAGLFYLKQGIYAPDSLSPDPSLNF